MTRKGILLAGGTGSRLWPITLGTSKQLLPIYDKPMIYYPLSVLMLAGIREIAIITTPEDQPQFERLLGNGNQWGLNFSWIIQERPAGLAQAYVLARDFLAGAPSAMILGDNIFFGHGLREILSRANAQTNGGTVFVSHVSDPERYGVAAFDANGKLSRIVEKPAVPPSNFAITGLYFLDGHAPNVAAGIRPSARGEFEIVDVLEQFRAEAKLEVEFLGRGIAWLDTGTPGSLLEAGNFVRTLQDRQGMQVGSPDEVAFRQGWINRDSLAERARMFEKSSYGAHLAALLRE